MVAKMVLPFLGGAATVWTTAVLFFQVALFAGYLYADRVARIKSLPTQAVVHLLLMATAFVFLPIGFGGRPPPDQNSNPVIWELTGLLHTAGVPYFFVATTSPLLQNWFSRSNDPGARDPYFLYAASNSGSLFALLMYPFIVEPQVGLRDQSLWWSAGYGSLLLLVCLVAAILWTTPTRKEPSEETVATPPDLKTRSYWLAATFIPSVLMLGVTAHISVNLAPMPLVWIVPLAVYLLTFILAFGRRIRVSHRFMSWLAPAVLVLLSPLIGIEAAQSRIVVFLIAAHLYLLFTGAMLCHAALAASRPPARYLTEYYVWIALGGALGGVFAAVLAPMLFTSIFEYPLFLAAAAFFRLPARRGRWLAAPVLSALILGAALALPAYFAEPGRRTVYVTRNFFGVKKVVDRDEGTRWFVHGDTIHGIELRNNLGEPLAYYHREGPVGEVMSLLADRPNQHIGVLGLGAGSIAAYAGPSRHVTFFEIDPDVQAIATRYFTFLSRCGRRCDVITGDGRLSLSKFPNRAFDLLVIDAFNSDSVPPHLISQEALEIYLSKLKPDGAILFHVSNRYLRVKELISALVVDSNLPAFARVDDAEPGRYKTGSQYVIAGTALDGIPALGIAANPLWAPVSRPKGLSIWTDDYSNMIALLRWLPSPN
jgi:SAM-dependent methyltransferase